MIAVQAWRTRAMSVVSAGWAPADSGIITAAIEKMPANRGAIDRIFRLLRLLRGSRQIIALHVELGEVKN